MAKSSPIDIRDAIDVLVREIQRGRDSVIDAGGWISEEDMLSYFGVTYNTYIGKDDNR